MNNNFKKSVADMRLTQEEKALGEQKLVKFMQANPVRISDAARYQSWSTLVRSNLNFLTQNFMKAFLVKPIGAVLGLLIVGGMGTSFAAQGSMPGDVLYPVKVNFNEKVAEMVQLSTKAKAEVALSQAQTRLEEAEKLVEQGKLDSENQKELTANFKEKVAKTKGLVKQQKAENDQAGATEMSDKLNSSLKAHQKVLENLAEKGRSDSHAAEVINGLITNVKSSFDDENEQKDSEIKTQESAEKSESTEKETEEVKTTLPTIKTEGQTGLQIKAPEVESKTELEVEGADDLRTGL